MLSTDIFIWKGIIVSFCIILCIYIIFIVMNPNKTGYTHFIGMIIWYVA